MNAHTLYASVLRLVARNDTVLPSSNGQYAYAAFLRLLNDVDPDMARILHDPNMRKPFTVSPLLGDFRIRDRHIHLRRGDECWLRFTLIGAELFKVFTQQFVLGRARPGVCLGAEGQEAYFDITEVRTTGGSHPWAGAITAGALLPTAPPARKITLEFFTPTTFEARSTTSIEDRIQVVPLPEFVFGNLAQKWLAMRFDQVLAVRQPSPEMALAGTPPSALVDDRPPALAVWREQFAQQVVITGLRDLTTHAVRLKGQAFIGATGFVTYEIFGDVAFCRQVNMLADAAFYFGVGRKTTMGMGMCQRIVGF